MNTDRPGIGGTKFKIKLDKDWFNKADILMDARPKLRRLTDWLHITKRKTFWHGTKEAIKKSKEKL